MEKKSKKPETKYCLTQKYEYKGNNFAAGLVKNSKHKENRIFLKICGWTFDLTPDEAMAIVAGLSEVMWIHFFLSPMKKGYGKLKWISLQQMLKKVNRGNNKQRGAVVG